MDVDEILLQDGFVDWANKANTTAAKEWQLFMQNNSIDQANIDKAMLLLHQLQHLETKPSEEEIREQKEKLLAALITNTPKPFKVVELYKKWWLSVAACLAIGMASMVYFNAQKEVTIKTQYGEIKTNQLPDGTEVVLNSNSNINYSPKKIKSKREVWINGEAFFKVDKKVNSQNFLVHTNQFDIEVTGTHFNVVNRKAMASVLLTEGSITIHNNNGTTVFLEPGDYYAFGKDEMNGKPTTIIKRKEEEVTAWMDKKIVFENTPLIQVANTILDLYGIEVVFANNNIATKTVSGILPTNNIETFINALKATTDYNIEMANNKIKIAIK